MFITKLHHPETHSSLVNISILETHYGFLQDPNHLLSSLFKSKINCETIKTRILPMDLPIFLHVVVDIPLLGVLALGSTRFEHKLPRAQHFVWFFLVVLLHCAETLLCVMWEHF